MSVALADSRGRTALRSEVVDFDLHGLLRLRLIDPPAAALHSLASTLGSAAESPVAPDLAVRWVARLPDLGTVQYLGGRDFAVTEEGSVVRTCGTGRTLIPLAGLKTGVEIACERGVQEPPLLRPLLHTLALARGVAAAHASAFIYGGRGVLVTGWPSGSKTGTLLAFMARGARFIGDDCVYLADAGERMCGLPEPVGVREAYLRDFPELAARVPRAGMGLYGCLRAAHRLTRAWLGSSRRAVPRKLLGALERRLKSPIPPEQLFGSEACPFSGRLEQVYVLQPTSGSAVEITPADPDLVAEQLLMTSRGEMRSLTDSYTRLRFARPGVVDPLLEDMEAVQRRALRAALARKEAFHVSHPHGVPVLELFERMRHRIER